MIQIKYLKKVDVLVALYNHAYPQGLDPRTTENRLSDAEAREILDASRDKLFDRVKGKAIYVDLSADVIYEDIYDQVNGTGCAKRALYPLFEREVVKLMEG